MFIGKVKVDPPVVLAPMAGVTDASFRVLVKEQGAGLLVSEMVSCKGLLHNNKKTHDLFCFSDEERPFAIQLFGNEPAEMVAAAKKVAEYSPDIIDINMGCPVPKVVSNGEGAALLKKPDLVYEIVARIVESIKIPVTVKMRSGWDEKSINAIEIATQIAKAGAAAVTLHARTRSQFYSGNADWQMIKAVKEAVKIPVIGNGDIKSATDVKRMLDETGCDAVMIGRAAEGNPWLFNEVKSFLCFGDIPSKPSIEEKFSMVLRHLSMLIANKGEIIAIKEMRRHVAAYIKGLPHAAEFRNTFNTAVTEKDFIGVVRHYIAMLR